jgi:hypothetical protein
MIGIVHALQCMARMDFCFLYSFDELHSPHSDLVHTISQRHGVLRARPFLQFFLSSTPSVPRRETWRLSISRRIAQSKVSMSTTLPCHGCP